MLGSGLLQSRAQILELGGQLREIGAGLLEFAAHGFDFLTALGEFALHAFQLPLESGGALFPRGLGLCVGGGSRFAFGPLGTDLLAALLQLGLQGAHSFAAVLNVGFEGRNPLGGSVACFRVLCSRPLELLAHFVEERSCIFELGGQSCDLHLDLGLLGLRLGEGDLGFAARLGQLDIAQAQLAAGLFQLSGGLLQFGFDFAEPHFVCLSALERTLQLGDTLLGLLGLALGFGQGQALGLELVFQFADAALRLFGGAAGLGDAHFECALGSAQLVQFQAEQVAGLAQIGELGGLRLGLRARLGELGFQLRHSRDVGFFRCLDLGLMLGPRAFHFLTDGVQFRSAALQLRAGLVQLLTQLGPYGLQFLADAVPLLAQIAALGRHRLELLNTRGEVVDHRRLTVEFSFLLGGHALQAILPVQEFRCGAARRVLLVAELGVEAVHVGGGFFRRHLGRLPGQLVYSVAQGQDLLVLGGELLPELSLCNIEGSDDLAHAPLQ